MKKSILTLLFCILLFHFSKSQQKSIARVWNEALLESIRNDFARPVVHARNLFHISAAMYDSWSIHAGKGHPYFLGETVHGFTIPFSPTIFDGTISDNQEKTLSYACYRLIAHRFRFAPGYQEILPMINSIMDSLNYDISYINSDYTTGDAASLGNYLAEQIIMYGVQDGSNEYQDYNNQYYQAVNEPLALDLPFDISTVHDPNHWQPLSFETFIDQSGNPIPGATPAFIGAEWGNVFSFALKDTDSKVFDMNGGETLLFNDTGKPANLGEDSAETAQYKWSFQLVSIWSAQLDPYDGVNWDISPGSIGNIVDYPDSFNDYIEFYDLENGGELPGIADGHPINPRTNTSYEEQIVPRGDYARVLAEFWADGPDSETPPGHWFTILNSVNDHPDLVRKFEGSGDEMDQLEWDIKSYFTLGGAMHDVAVSVWSIKGYYDYVRPITAIRYMAALGQSNDPDKVNFHPHGIQLKPGYIEEVLQSDPLAGNNGEHVGKIKVKAWRGHDLISDPTTDEAGVGWILAENWWPYQRPSFVTPPFAGYISGHSTFSSAAATVLTRLTADEFFPGGIGEFVAKKNEFLVFEKGPSVDVRLQWATYYDAADQCSLSRIWGGIHPPMDDIRGRILGRKLGAQSFGLAKLYFNNTLITETNIDEQSLAIYPNPTTSSGILNIDSDKVINAVELYNSAGLLVYQKGIEESIFTIDIQSLQLAKGTYLLQIKQAEKSATKRIIVID
ncbi:MAG: hypothetical protein CMB80_32060 [Flammeovirgaceae bacterium]|nr:hypothetical protein [Flammeovirgaceae bacterium]HCX20290.1 hypothetical protein [Cytophagales bacterium]|tara:strand:- start:3995 stop:6187 length:2193 start_codon:yes stop_codon:yes gene_type:complete